MAVLNHYEKMGVLKMINGEQSVEKVHQDILREIDQS
jgi:adenylate kinase family enzyme